MNIIIKAFRYLAPLLKPRVFFCYPIFQFLLFAIQASNKTSNMDLSPSFYKNGRGGNT